MRSLALSFGVLALVAAAPAQAQFTTAISTPKQSATYTPAPTGGFLGGGSDDCAAARAAVAGAPRPACADGDAAAGASVPAALQPAAFEPLAD